MLFTCQHYSFWHKAEALMLPGQSVYRSHSEVDLKCHPLCSVAGPLFPQKILLCLLTVVATTAIPHGWTNMYYRSPLAKQHNVSCEGSCKKPSQQVWTMTKPIFNSYALVGNRENLHTWQCRQASTSRVFEKSSLSADNLHHWKGTRPF